MKKGEEGIFFSRGEKRVGGGGKRKREIRGKAILFRKTKRKLFFGKDGKAAEESFARGRRGRKEAKRINVNAI